MQTWWVEEVQAPGIDEVYAPRIEWDCPFGKSVDFVIR
jgi:hypothetical protein